MATTLERAIAKGMIMNMEKLWTKTFCLIIIVNCFTYIGNFMLMPTLPLLALELGASKLTAELVTFIKIRIHDKKYLIKLMHYC